jgi:hypothetical protein
MRRLPSKRMVRTMSRTTGKTMVGMTTPQTSKKALTTPGLTMMTRATTKVMTRTMITTRVTMTTWTIMARTTPRIMPAIEPAGLQQKLYAVRYVERK